jgi:hypothetical protein
MEVAFKAFTSRKGAKTQSFLDYRFLQLIGLG